MIPKDLVAHKQAEKRLTISPVFKPMKKGKYPKPFKAMGGARLNATEIIDVSDTHCVIFIWRDGEELTDSMFLAWLFCKLSNGDLSPIFEMHLHPSHKGLHAKTPCLTEFNYTNRQLPGAPELELKISRIYDPRNQSDRDVLIETFCTRCGIKIGNEDNLWNS